MVKISIIYFYEFYIIEKRSAPKASLSRFFPTNIGTENYLFVFFF